MCLKVVRLNITSHMLKQASNGWTQLSLSKLESFGFEQCLFGTRVFQLLEKGSRKELKLIVVTYTDDFVSGGKLNNVE